MTLDVIAHFNDIVNAALEAHLPSSGDAELAAHAPFEIHISDDEFDLESDNCVKNKVITQAISEILALIAEKARVVDTANSITLDMDSETHYITAKLYDKDGNVLSQARVNASPASAVIVDGYYDDETEKIVLDLSTGASISFSVADLVNGLASDASVSQHTSDSDIHVTAADKLKWDGKQDALRAGSNVTIKNGVISVEIPLPPVDSVNGKTGTVVLDSDDIQDVSSDDPSTITQSFSRIRETIRSILSTLLGKQNTLTPGANVQIQDDVISATDTVYDDTEVRSMISDVRGSADDAQTDVDALKTRMDAAENTYAGMNAMMSSLAQSKASTEYVDQKVAEIEAPDIPAAAQTTPSMDGVGAAGVSDEYSRADHVHPIDTSRASAEDMAAVQQSIKDLEEGKAGTDELPVASDDTPLMDDATASAGESEKYSRADHKHPRDGNIMYWAQVTFQTLANLVTSFASNNDDTHYPSSKLVKDNLDALKAYVDDQYGPHTVWETDPSNGLQYCGGKSRNIESDGKWQLTGLDMTAYKYVLVYIKACAGTVVDQEGFSMVVRVNLDASAITPRSNIYVGSHVGYYPNDNGVKYGAVCNVDSTKTKFAMNYCNANTTGTTALERDGKVYKIEGYKS